MGKRPEQKLQKDDIQNVNKHKYMLNSISHWRDVNQTHIETVTYWLAKMKHWKYNGWRVSWATNAKLFGRKKIFQDLPNTSWLPFLEKFSRYSFIPESSLEPLPNQSLTPKKQTLICFLTLYFSFAYSRCHIYSIITVWNFNFQPLSTHCNFLFFFF